GMKPTATARLRNMTARSEAASSFRVKYQCPDAALVKFEISPRTATCAKLASRSPPTWRLSCETERTRSPRREVADMGQIPIQGRTKRNNYSKRPTTRPLMRMTTRPKAAGRDLALSEPFCGRKVDLGISAFHKCLASVKSLKYQSN